MTSVITSTKLVFFASFFAIFFHADLAYSKDLSTVIGKKIRYIEIGAPRKFTYEFFNNDTKNILDKKYEPKNIADADLAIIFVKKFGEARKLKNFGHIFKSADEDTDRVIKIAKIKVKIDEVNRDMLFIVYKIHNFVVNYKCLAAYTFRIVRNYSSTHEEYPISNCIEPQIGGATSN